MEDKGPQVVSQETPPSRRGFLNLASSAAMTGGLLAGYGTLGAMAVRFLYPTKDRPKVWVYVAEAKNVRAGAGLRYQIPSGQTVTIARRGEEDDFFALSSTCPHLGCQVSWESQNARFFCPCHNGAFDPEGKAIAGPPAEARQSLPQYPIRVEKGLIFLEVPL